MNSHAREVRHRAQHGFCILLALVLLGVYAVVALLYLVGDGLKTVAQRCGSVGRNKPTAFPAESRNSPETASALFRPTRLDRLLDWWSIRGL